MRIDILSKNQQNEFDTPPKFSLTERRIAFDIPDSLRGYVRKIEISTSIVSFILQYGYFKASGKFFSVNDFNQIDIDAVCRWNEIDIDNLDWSNHHRATLHRQKKYILIHFGIHPFGEKQKELLSQETLRLLKKQKRHNSVFWILAEYLRDHRIEIPTYYALYTIIQSSIKTLDEHYFELIDSLLTISTQNLLEGLLKKEEATSTYNLTKLKNPNETIRLRDIRENISDYNYFKNLFHQIEPITSKLELSTEVIDHYAQFVIRSQVFQVSRRENKYFILICFIIYQYYFLGDLLLETIISATKEIENSVSKVTKNILLENQSSTEQDLETVISLSKNMAVHVKNLLHIKDSEMKSKKERSEYYEHFANEKFLYEFVHILEPINRIRKKGLQKEPIFYQVLEDHSHKLQNRVAQLLRTIDFEVSNPNLQKAIIEFKKKEGIITDTFETDFLTQDEKKNAKNAQSKPALYKILLTKHLSLGIKAGEISLMHSFQHQAFDKYLIDKEHWQKNKNDILQNLNLLDKKDWVSVQKKIQFSLQNAFDKTYENLNTIDNPYVKVSTKNKRPQFSTPTKEKSNKEDLKSIFPPESSVPILEILNTINLSTQFTNAFTHWSNKSIPKKPSDMELFAIIMAYGCNIGLNNMAKNTTNINANTLNNTANWYFSLDNIQKANDMIIEFTEKLKMVEFLKKEQPIVHSSSDGQKFYVKADSIHANYSFKYFGKDKGIVMYSFIDNLHRLFYATAISASEREAHYVLDGLLHNEVIETDLHSTDSHGYTELVFALTYLLDIEFAPRIAHFQDHQLFYFDGIVIPNLKFYELNLKEIKAKNIEEQWDKILHIVATLKLKNTSASTLFKRLNSYSRQNSTYLALRDLGRLVRTKFLLDYMYDHNLRQMIQQQLNKGESSNQLSKYIFYGNNGQIKYPSKEEHLQATACKTLIHNLIICWNYMYLSKQFIKTKPENRKDFYEKIKQISPVRWEHINFYGIFDFSPEALKNALEFNADELFNFEME